ncbi:hypothetical protein [Treponema bryantii]|uniref:hypothetical protein n=1 Tax=Treponema bryantii TaxID=163 RepID=UPI0003B6C32F|nr:hypothetical protein [Treponema bryantii]
MKNVLKYSIFSILLIALFISCEIGLGNSVDTEVPVQEIKTPNPASVAVIRGDFPVTGVWSDDGSIESVIVTIKNDTSTVFEGNASVQTTENGKGTWSCIVSPHENGIKDGSYYVSVKIQDTAEHSSIASSQIVIDNTPPVIVLSHPSTIAGDSSLDTYGTVFSLNGQAADDNGVDLIEVNVFSDAAKQNKLHTIELKNVPNTIKLKVAEFEEGENNDYAKIYGSTISDGERNRFCTIVAYDGAQYYPVDGSEQSAEDKKGNAADVYYLSENEAISQLINQYKITGLYQMMAGTYSEDGTARAAIDPLSVLKANEIGLGAFALDPENNPKFIVTNKYEISNGISKDDSKLINNSSLVVEVAPGLDGSPLDVSSLKVYAIQCDANGNLLNNNKLYPASTTPVSIGSSYQIAVTFSAGKIEDGKFKTNEYYKLGVEGTDDNGKNIIPSVRKGYGFYFTTSGILPTVEVTSPSDDAVFKTGDNVTVDGTVNFIEDGVFSLDLIDESGAKITLVSPVADDNGVSATDLPAGRLSYIKDSSNDRLYHFKYIIPASKFDQSVTKSYTISFPNPNADTSIKYDAQKPTVELKFTGTADDNTQLGPLARKFTDSETVTYADNVNYVNGTFTFEYKVKDEDNGSGVNLDAKKPEVKVYEEGITEPKLTQTFNAETKTVSVDTDTLGFNDGRNVRVVVTAYDKSGNKTEETKSYKLDKSTDLPKIYPVQQTGSKPLTFTKNTKTSVENQNDYNTLVADDPTFKLKFFDDDGLVGKALSVTVNYDKDGNGSDVRTPPAVECVPDENGAEETFTIPEATSGFYKITVTATDKVGDDEEVRKTTTKEFWVRITPSAPSVRINDLSSRYVTNSTSANNITSSAITKLEPEVIIDSTEKPFKITRRVIYKDTNTNTEKESFKAIGSLTAIDDDSDSRLTANADGTYTYKETYTPPTDFAAGEYSIAYKVYDSNGNSSSASETDPAVFFIDNRYETINEDNITVPADTDNAGTSFTFKVSVTAQGVAPLSYRWAFTDADVTTAPEDSAFVTTSNQNYKYTYPAAWTQAQGKKRLWLYTVDAAGNKSDVQSKDFYYDLAKPVVSFQETNFDTKQVFSLHVNASDSWALDSIELFKIVDNNPVSTGKKQSSISTNPATWIITDLPAATIAADTFEVYNYFVRAKDKAGKTTDSSTITVRVDNKKPEITEVKFGSENTNILNGSLGEIKITSKDTGLGLKELHYTISGTNTTTVPEETINLAGAGETTTIISKELGTGKDLPEGKYTLSCDVTDLADNSYTEAAKEFYVDLAAPELSDVKIQAEGASAEEITEGSIKYLNTASKLKLTGKITESNGFEESGLGVMIKGVSIDASNITVSGTAPDYTFAVSNIVIPENDKEISIKVTAADIAGQSSEKNYTIWNDITEPEITFITPDKSTTYEGNNSISGAKYNFNISLSDTGSKLKNLKYCIEGYAENAEQPSGSWTDVTTASAITGKLSSAFAFEKTLKASGNTGAGDLAEGHYTLFVYVEDSVGNSKIDKVSFWIDQAAPSLTCSAISPTGGQTIDGYVVSKVSPTLTINASDTNALKSVSVASGDTPAAFTEIPVSITEGAVSNVDVPLTLSDGKHKIVITAKDTAGRKKTEERFVWIDSAAPTGTFDIETPVYTDSSANKWYNDSYIDLTLTNVKDEGGSGIYQVKATSDNTNWYPLSLNETPANSGIYTSGGKINCTAQGGNSITVKIVDNAGKETSQPYSVYIDTDAPNHAEIKEVKVDTQIEANSGTVLVNGEKDMTIKLEAEDAASGAGIKSVAVKGGTPVTEAGSDGYYTITISKDDIASGALVFEVIDYVNNKYEYISDLVIDLDNEKPAVSIDPVTDADPDTTDIDVNGTFTISGKASDNNSLASIKLEYKIGTGNWTTYATLNTGLEAWSINVDTKSETSPFKEIDEENVEFRATAIDSAQNTKVSSSNTVYINQSSDIPVITFTDFDVSTMKAETPLLSQSQNIYCSVYDDDGEVTVEVSTNDGTSYTPVTLTNGSFTLTLADGTYDSSTNPDAKPAIKFKVQDSLATNPITNPRIKGKIVSGSKTTSTLSKLLIKVDTTAPELSEEKYYKSWATPPAWENFSSSLTLGESLGGLRQTLYLQIKVEDANPIDSVKATFTPDSTNEDDYSTFEKTSPTSSVYKGEISVVGLPSGQNKLIIIASDGINESKKEISLTVDNTPPLITVDSHEDGDTIHKDFVLEGNIDSDKDTKLYYKITKPGATTPATSLNGSGWNPVTGNNLLKWKIYFDKTAAVTNQEGQDCHDLLPKYLIAREYHDKVSIGSDGIAYLKENGVVTTTKYMHNESFNFNFFAVDGIGNISEVTILPLVLDPQGDIPNIVLEYPANNALVSGVIRLSGSADFVNEPKALYMQIYPQYDDDTFDEDDWEDWEEKEFPKEAKHFSDYTSEYDIQAIGDSGMRGIYIGNSLSWSKTINMKSEFERSDNTNNKIAVRLFAVDANNNISSTENTIYVFEVNAGAPKIGSSEQLILKQNMDTANEKLLNYKEGMWIKGEWYLTGSVEDDDAQGIQSIVVTDETTGAVIANAYDTTPVNGVWQYAGKATKGYRLKIPVGSNTGAAKKKYKITAKDYDNQTSEMEILINYDNNAPVLATSVSEEYKISSDIYDQNGKYSMESVASESSAESGFLRTVYYFTNEDGDKVYDSSWSEVSITGNPDTADHLYWKEKTASAIDGFDVTINSADSEIKKGSLAKIGGTIYSITGVDGTKITLDSAPDSSLAGKKIYFVLGNVVSRGGITTLGTKTRWSEVIEKTKDKLPDGAIKLTYVVFDKAGNLEYEEIDALVKNNAPRLASVKVWTDYNGDSIEQEVECQTGYYSYSDRWFKDDANNKLYTRDTPIDAIRDYFVISGNGKGPSEGGTAFTMVHEDVVFTPEIIGGNGKLYYNTGDEITTSTRTALKVKVNDNTYTDITGHTSESAYTKKDEDGQLYIEGLKPKITCALGSLAEGTAASPTWCTYTISDSTPGTKQLSVTFDVALEVIKTDNSDPSTDMEDFYWTSGEDNSLYKNKKENGHIELPDDFKDVEDENGEKIYNATATSGEYDLDPKVSGKITMRGSVEDNIRLKEIYVKIDGVGSSTELPFNAYKKVASYSAGSWTLVQDDTEGDDLTNHWAFTITDEYNDARGHKANWEFSWDTSYIATVAKTDVKVFIQAKDTASKTSADNNMQMDVVPYITSVVTSIGDGAVNINARTARGHYPERSGNTLKLNGFNLATGNAQVTDIPLPSTSGSFGYTVNTDVVTLNNKNSNEVEYNQQPNNRNNNTLTDDVVIDVWEFDSSAVVPKKGTIDQPIMKINPVTDKIGFAFADGPLNFNMGGKTREADNDNKNRGNKTGAPATGDDTRPEYSYHTWISGFDAYTSIAFAYDALGNSYGIAAGGDISADDSSDKFCFFTGRWGNADYGSQSGSKGTGSWGNGTDNSKLRLSQIGQSINSKNVQNKQRNMNPSLATSVSGTSTNVYFAYYDAISKELRYKAGTINTGSRSEFNDFKDTASQDKPMTHDADAVYMDIISGGTSSNTTVVPGKYLSIGVDSHGTNDVAVLTWYDETHSTLWFAYNETPNTGIGVEAPRNGTNWNISRVFAEDSPYAKAGQFVQLAVDAKGGIHIAAYDSVKCNLVYAYKAAYNIQSFTSCIVDSYGIVGSNISLDVAMTESGDDGKAIPYIGYYASSNVKPKLATLPEGISSADDVKDGAVEDKFTGEWECSLLPTPSNLQMNSKQYNHINVCSWKDKDGVLKLSSTADAVTGREKVANNTSLSHTHGGDNGAAFSTKKFGHVTGNGTNKPILAYNIKNGTAVETAQMK